MEWLEAVARGWNARPTPFIGGKLRSAANGRENGAMVSVVQEPSSPAHSPSRGSYQ